MPTGIPTDQSIKAETLDKIRNEGMTVTQASTQYSISSKSIYMWLRSGVADSDKNLILENNKLRKELEMAYRLLGRATAELNRPKL